MSGKDKNIGDSFDHDFFIMHLEYQLQRAKKYEEMLRGHDNVIKYLNDCFMETTGTEFKIDCNKDELIKIIIEKRKKKIRA
jgi:hypothetical protein